MNIDHRLYVALSSDSAPKDVEFSAMVSYLADAADASWNYACDWYTNWLQKQESPAEGYISEDPMIDAEIKNFFAAQDAAYGKFPPAQEWREGEPTFKFDESIIPSDLWEQVDAAMEKMSNDEPPLDRLQRLGQEMDAINPSHYRQGNVECIDAICDALGDEQFKGYLRGNVLKYLWRLEHKGSPLENARKGAWYLDRLINELEIEKECE